MKNPFHLIQDNCDYSDYETYVELPTLGKERSIVIRLSFNHKEGTGYSSLTYEVNGSHTELRDGIPGDVFREIVGLPPSVETINAELVSALKGLLQHFEGPQCLASDFPANFYLAEVMKARDAISRASQPQSPSS